MDREQLKRMVGLSVYGAGRTMFYGGSACAVSVLLLQLMTWLQAGQWTPLPLTTAFGWLVLHVCSVSTALSFLAWADRPLSWLGLHELLAITPTALASATVAFLGLLMSDHGLGIRRHAEKWLHDAAAESAHRHQPAAESRIHSTVNFADPGTHLELSAETPHFTGNVTAVERDIMRWLAINESEPHLNSLNVLSRHLGYSAAELELGAAALARQGFIKPAAGRLCLSDSGLSYCVAAGWTISMRRPH